MNKRYMKVLVLYILSSAIAATVGKSLSLKRCTKWGVETAVGFAVFSCGLKWMKKAKTNRES